MKLSLLRIHGFSNRLGDNAKSVLSQQLPPCCSRKPSQVRFVHDTCLSVFPAPLNEPPSYVPVCHVWACHNQPCLLLHVLCQGGDKQVGSCQVLQDIHCEYIIKRPLSG